MGTFFNESEMALFFECTDRYAQKGLDTADIVREAIFRQSAPRAAALHFHPLWKNREKKTRRNGYPAVCGFRSFTQRLARLPLVLLAEAVIGRLRSQGIRSHQ